VFPFLSNAHIVGNIFNSTLLPSKSNVLSNALLEPVPANINLFPALDCSITLAVCSRALGTRSSYTHATLSTKSPFCSFTAVL